MQLKHRKKLQFCLQTDNFRTKIRFFTQLIEINYLI
ncbi:hypothetical protein VINE108274_13900 [Vibrio neptunius]